MQFRNRKRYEALMARMFAYVTRRRLLRLLLLLGWPPDLRRLPAAIWTEFEFELAKVFLPGLAEIFRDSAEQLVNGLDLGLDWGSVHQLAIQWARTYGFELIHGLTETTRNLTSTAIQNFFAVPGQTREQLEADLREAFSPRRASTIAVTEVTRASTAGELAAAEELRKYGIDLVPVWRTNNDELVCPVCGPRNGKRVTDGFYPPAHPNCRCWLSHLLPGTPAAEQLKPVPAREPTGEPGKGLDPSLVGYIADPKQLELELKALELADTEVTWGGALHDTKHLGPGPHPSGSDQSVHGSGGSLTDPDEGQPTGNAWGEPARVEARTQYRLELSQEWLQERASEGAPEGAVIISRYGEEVGTRIGQATSITFSEEDLQAMYMGALSHSHPYDWGFSPQDLALMWSVKLREIRAVAKTHTYIFRPPQDWPEYFPELLSRITNELLTVTADALREELQARGDRPLTQEESEKFNRAFSDALVEELAEYGGEYIIRRNP